MTFTEGLSLTIDFAGQATFGVSTTPGADAFTQGRTPRLTEAATSAAKSAAVSTTA